MLTGKASTTPGEGFHNILSHVNTLWKLFWRLIAEFHYKSFVRLVRLRKILVLETLETDRALFCALVVAARRASSKCTISRCTIHSNWHAGKEAINVNSQLKIRSGATERTAVRLTATRIVKRRHKPHERTQSSALCFQEHWRTISKRLTSRASPNRPQIQSRIFFENP